MNIKNNKKSRQSIQKLKKTICNLLNVQGHEGLTITNICKAANVNRTTFYAHFDSIEDALYHICEEYIIKIYEIFLNVSLPYKERIKKSLLIIRGNIDFFSYLFANVHNLELRVIEMIENNKFHTSENEMADEKAKLSLAFIISGFVGIAKIYFRDIAENSSLKISVDDFSDLICNVVNKENPYFIIK